MDKVRILIADDHGLVRKGLRAVLQSRPDWNVCGEAENGRQAIELAEKLKPTLVVMDIMMPELNGLEAARKILSSLPQTLVLVQTMHDSEVLAREALAAGARGYLHKHDPPEILVKAIEAMVEGRTYFTPRISQLVQAKYSAGVTEVGAPVETRGRLTPRERELVQLLAEGKSNKESAALLGISLNTVETHRKNVMSKLKLQSSPDLVRYAIRNHLIEP